MLIPRALYINISKQIRPQVEETVAALRRGLERGEFRVLYQPIVELPEATVRGVEALVRWHPGDGDPVSPAEFIPVAEQTGLIVDLGA